MTPPFDIATISQPVVCPLIIPQKIEPINTLLINKAGAARTTIAAADRTAYGFQMARTRPLAADKSGGSAQQEARLALLAGVADALRCCVKYDTEVVVHDLRHPESSIVHIVNGHVSGRVVGQSIIAGPSGDKAFNELVGDRGFGTPNEVRVIADYESVAGDGRPLRSSSVVIFSEGGQAAATLCLNVDMGAAEKIQVELRRLLQSGMPPAEAQAPSVAIGTGTMDELVGEIIASAIATSGVPVARMKKAEKLSAVAAMHERGLFLLRGSVELVAKRLGTTRFTIYNYLDEIGTPANSSRP